MDAFQEDAFQDDGFQTEGAPPSPSGGHAKRRPREEPEPLIDDELFEVI